ncbi:MAG: hypothetical protein AABX95_02510, partial [Nanoarchaeota archaeon]
MLNKNRKGVSEVVANVLIVLLVIVGIAVIWSVVKPTVDKGSQGIKTGAECLSLSLEPVSCVTATCVSYTDSVACSGAGCSWGGTPSACTGASPVVTNKTVVIKRNPGAGTFESVELVFSDGTNSGSVSATTSSTSLGELSTATLLKSIPASI